MIIYLGNSPLQKLWRDWAPAFGTEISGIIRVKKKKKNRKLGSPLQVPPLPFAYFPCMHIFVILPYK